MKKNVVYGVFAAVILLMAAACNKNESDPVYSGCCDDVIFVSGSLDTNLVFSNVVTPNGDGYNDILHIIKHPTSKLLFTVFDDDKNILYQDSSYANNFKGYDKNGKLMADGKYIYKVKNQKGEVTAFVCILTQKKSSTELGTCISKNSGDPLIE